MEKIVGIGQRAKAIVENRQQNHHQHRRQNESAESHGRAAPPAQTKPEISNRVAGGGARQTLAQSERFDEVMLSQPASLQHNQMPNLTQHSKAAAESADTDFQK